jgi:hypothetical protein
MRKTAILVLILALASNLSFAQFKEVPNKTRTQLKSSSSGLIFGFINPKNFSIEHSFNMSYASLGNNTQVSLASYTATLSYRIRDNMKISADVSMSYSPFASIGSSNATVNRDFQNSFNGLNLSRVSFDYKPSKNVYISLNYYNSKNSNMWMYDNNLYNRYYGF